ncbi:Pectate lyase [Quillaja saponaria]|uniref:Pectate lyase n=1 Tax=Quillaja saponaria TaxID=32244 RepID=A0AAD7KRB7_QUISA|nr:Pectate lyase [Quillaja saponaria]
MAGLNKFFLLFFFLSFSVTIPTLHANIYEFDEYWQQRAKHARQAALNAYDPDPLGVIGNLTSHVDETMIGTNNTRRNLKATNGPCEATNPIDRCWRCDPNWANNRKKLADCVQGFGRKTIGGKNGPFYVVNDSSDNDMVNPKPGTLRHAVIQKGPLWIIFARSMTIRLNQELIMTSDKTIDGRGAIVQIATGAGITIQFINNVIIHGIKIHDIVQGSGGNIRDAVDHVGFRTRSDGDGISIFGSSNVWIDHVSMSKCYDGLVDAIMGSTGITISNCHFTHHNEVMLFGASDSFSSDKVMQITVAFNHFGQGLVQRMPRCRWGFFHVVNNDYTHWLMYAIGGSQNPTIISEGNRFIAPPNPNAKEVTKRDYAEESVWKNWQWRSRKDVLMNGAFFKQSGPELNGRGPFSRLDMISSKPGEMVGRLTRYSGALNCRAGVPC